MVYVDSIGPNGRAFIPKPEETSAKIADVGTKEDKLKDAALIDSFFEKETKAPARTRKSTKK